MDQDDSVWRDEKTVEKEMSDWNQEKERKTQWYNDFIENEKRVKEQQEKEKKAREWKEKMKSITINTVIKGR